MLKFVFIFGVLWWLLYGSNTMFDLLNKDGTSINHAPGMQLIAKISAHNESPLTETSVAACAKPCNNSPISLDQRTPQSSLAIVGDKLFLMQILSL